ncbi:MAG: DUF2061 domain-containing protein [Bacteriovoracaceae bacterium]|nr:DUF2061 domain-containing protein [Bacteriovoracaceae bacterium]
METRRRSVIKGITWRITGSLDTVIIAYFFTRSFKQATSIGAVEVVTKIILYYFHERAWLRIPWGKVKS